MIIMPRKTLEVPPSPPMPGLDTDTCKDLLSWQMIDVSDVDTTDAEVGTR